MVKTQELGVGLDIVKHAAQKAFQVDSALHVEAHFWKEKYPYIVFTSIWAAPETWGGRRAEAKLSTH
jgi:hypothetical protein